MAQVSIASVEMLEETVAAMDAAYSEAVEECSKRVECVRQMQETAQAAYLEAKNAAAMAAEEVQNLEAAAEEARSRLEPAQARLEEAQSVLQAAQSELESAELALSCAVTEEEIASAQEDVDAAESEVSSAESEVSSAENEVQAIESQIAAIENTLAAARARLQAAQERAAIMQQSLTEANALLQKTQQESSAVLRRMSGLADEGRARLQAATAALEAYMQTHPDTKALYDWLKWQPEAGKVITPDTINNRLTLTPGMLREYVSYLTEKDKSFRDKIAGYREKLDNAKTDEERAAVLSQIRRNLSGELSERIAAQAFSPIGTVKTQERTTFEDGKYTKTDIIITGLKETVILGRGEGMMAPKGGSLALEIKTGHSSYIKSQEEHMAFQSGGHTGCDASATICSRDIKDLSPESEEELRRRMREEGSPLLGMLPRKDEIDKALEDAVLDGEETQGGSKDSTKGNAQGGTKNDAKNGTQGGSRGGTK